MVSSRPWKQIKGWLSTLVLIQALVFVAYVGLAYYNGAVNNTVVENDLHRHQRADDARDLGNHRRWTPDAAMDGGSHRHRATDASMNAGSHPRRKADASMDRESHRIRTRGASMDLGSHRLGTTDASMDRGSHRRWSPNASRNMGSQRHGTTDASNVPGFPQQSVPRKVPLSTLSSAGRSEIHVHDANTSQNTTHHERNTSAAKIEWARSHAEAVKEFYDFVGKFSGEYSFKSNINEWMATEINVKPVYKLRDAAPGADLVDIAGVNTKCLRGGTLANRTVSSTARRCVCRPGWQGDHCSIPDAAHFSSAPSYTRNATLRTKPARRIVNALAINVEFDLLEARLHELADVVDVFVIHESNYTFYGEPKSLPLLQKLIQGFLKQFHHKIYYLFVGSFPEGGRADGWVAEKKQRRTIGRESMKRIVGLRSDDIFICTDSDEIPSRETLLYLKMHDGYPEPFGFRLRWTVFGFYWLSGDTEIYAGCSVATFRYVFENDMQQIRENRDVIVPKYITKKVKIHSWLFSQFGYTPAGWHCSWCLSPKGIRTKLTSAINGDFPRWGDYPHKLRLDYIANLIKTGSWFDDKRTVGTLASPNDSYYAPKYLMHNLKKFKQILIKQ